jgi:glycosyltransferase involved in cell wall biosynthesis
MRVCLIASSRFPVAEPFHGGLEAHTATLAGALIERGHEVSVFAAPGSDPRFNVDDLAVPRFSSSAAARADVGAMPEQWIQEHHAYLGLMLGLTRDAGERFDLVHNNSLHHLPVAMAAALDVPMVATLHTPPIAWLESAIALSSQAVAFASVSRFTADAWAHATASTVVMNGVDVRRWRPGPGGPHAVWTGRIVPEKAPHLAIEAARLADIEIDVAGPISDVAYFEERIVPLLGPEARYVGHLGADDLCALVGAAAVAVVSPCWDEPYGLVAAEAMACGTPVAALPRGALPELVTPRSGVLARGDDAAALAAAIRQARELDRDQVRRHAEDRLSLDRMIDGYEALYESTLLRRRTPA